MLKQGKLIVFEGPEKAGKTTQIKRLANNLRESGVNVLITREPGGLKETEGIREKLLDSISLSPQEELDLFLEDRHIHFEKVILPALEKDIWVLCDRCSPSTISYQHYGRGLDLEDIKKRDEIARHGREIDLVIFLNIDPRKSMEREEPDNRLEREDVAFHLNVWKGYISQSEKDPDRWFVVDGRKPREEAANLIWEEVQKRFLEVN
jgi:dTMP kinase